MKLTRYTMDKMEEAIKAIDLKTEAYMKLASVIDNTPTKATTAIFATVQP